jgi:hypothetical protein
MMRKAPFLPVSFSWFSGSLPPGQARRLPSLPATGFSLYEDHFENFEQAYEERFEGQGVLRVAPILDPGIRGCVEPERED